MRDLQILYYLEVRVYNVHGKCRYYRRYAGRSLLIAWIQHIHAWLASVGETTVIDTGNTSRTLYTPDNTGGYWHNRINASTDVSGIVVGTGSTAVTITDYKLATKIAHGTGAGQLSYGTQDDFGTMTPQSSTEHHQRWMRMFLNQSGAAVVIAEAGAYVQTYDNGAVVRYFCIARDVLASAVTVNNGEAVAIAYDFKIAL